jgi:hypothetical protein
VVVLESSIPSCSFSSPSDQPSEHMNTWVEHMKVREVGAEGGWGPWGLGAQSLLLT